MMLAGEILLSIHFQRSSSTLDMNALKHADVSFESPSRSFSGSSSASDTASCKEEKLCAQKTLAGRIAQIFNKNSDSGPSKSIDFPEPLEPTKTDISEDKSEDQAPAYSFEEAMKILESKDQGLEISSNLPGGVVVDQTYVITTQDLNNLLFSPDSSFPKAVYEVQGTTEVQVEPWRFENDGETLKRTSTYIKAANKMIKATKGFEEQTYLKADGKVFAIFVVVSTPEVIYGTTFKVELLYCITPGPELPSGEQSSRLVISWRINFLQSTMMKGMIETGARSGLKESFELYANLLNQTIKPVDSKDMGLNQEQILASLQTEPESDWKLGLKYFANFTVISSIFIGFYVLFHIWFATPSTIQGLEFVGLDLPDSIGEFVVCGVLVLQGERVLALILRFMQARRQKGNSFSIFFSLLSRITCLNSLMEFNYFCLCL